MSVSPPPSTRKIKTYLSRAVVRNSPPNSLRLWVLVGIEVWVEIVVQGTINQHLRDQSMSYRAGGAESRQDKRRLHFRRYFFWEKNETLSR